jgi:Leucine-rich repeat (LRR) protein
MTKNLITCILILSIFKTFGQVRFIELFEDRSSDKHIGNELYYRNKNESFKDTSFQSLEIDLKDFVNLDNESFESLCNNKSIIFLKLYNYSYREDTNAIESPEFRRMKNIRYLIFGGSVPNFGKSFFSELNKMPNLQYLAFPTLPKNISEYPDYRSLMLKLKGIACIYSDQILPTGIKLESFKISQNKKLLKTNLANIKSNNLLQLNISIDTLNEDLCRAISKFKNIEYLLMDYKYIAPEMVLSRELKKLKNLEVLILKKARTEDIRFLPEFKNLKKLKLEFRKKIADNIEPIFNIVSLEELEVISDSTLKININKINAPNLRKLKIYGHLRELPEKICDISSLKELNLIFNNIEYLPKSISKLQNLEVINLDHNQLKKLPDEFCNLKNLKQLLISENYLANLPDCIGKLSNLRVLSSDLNDIKMIPRSIGNCSELESLILDGNFLQTLPEEISKLNKLKILRLCKNNISELPKSINELEKLEKLELSNSRNYSFLDKSANRTERMKNDLVEVPKSISLLENLKFIDFEGNSKISNEAINIFIKSKSNDFSLNLSGCGITTLPDSGWLNFNCKRLDLDDNIISKLPKELFYSKIEELSLRNNELGKLNTYIENNTNLKILGYLSGFIKKDELKKQTNLFQTIIEVSNRFYYNKDKNPVLELYPIANEIDSIRAFNLINHFKYANALYDAKRYKECIPHYKLAIEDNLQGCMTLLNDLLECLQKMSKAYLYTSDTLNCIKGLELMQNKYKLNFNSEIGMLYKLMKNIDKSQIYFEKEERRSKTVKTKNNYEIAGNQLNLLELYLISENYKRFDSLSQMVKIEKEEEYLLRYYYIFEYLKILRQSSALNFESLVEKFTNELKNSKYSNVEWSCRLVEYWSKLQPERIRPIVFKLNNVICPEGY